LYRAVTPWQWPARVAWRLRQRADVVVEEHRIIVGRALPADVSLRIAFASDFHAGAATPWPILEASVATLEGLRPDLLLLGGDFVSIDPQTTARLARLLGTVRAPLGRFAVLGNHDHWAGASTVVAHLQQAGIEMLTNRSIVLPHPFGNVSVSGLDDHTSGQPDAEAAFAGAREVRVVLMHAPSGLLDIGERPFHVALCGHTHGGQIALPDGRPILTASGPLSRRYNAGRYSLNGHRTLLVSRGVGCGTLPIRWNSPSSVFLCSVAGE
jgi:predicted MPP superfamily phosphohydrolase